MMRKRNHISGMLFSIRAWLQIFKMIIRIAVLDYLRWNAVKSSTGFDLGKLTCCEMAIVNAEILKDCRHSLLSCVYQGWL